MNQPNDRPTPDEPGRDDFAPDELAPDNLDRLLQTWKAGREPSAEHLSSLRERIVASLAAEPKPLVAPGAAPTDLPTLRRRGVGTRLPTWLLAIAAALLISVGSFWLGRTTGEHGPTPDLARQELVEKARLFAEMRGMFGTQLEWLAEANDRVELGLAAPGETAEGARPVLVKLVVERRAVGGNWQSVWSADVIALDQQRVVAQPAGDASLSLWAYRLPDGSVFVESDLVLPQRLSSVETVTANVLENNRATEIGAFQSGGAQYRILQTAAALDGGTG